MTTLAQVDRHRIEVDDLSTLWFAELAALLDSLDGADPVEVRNALIAALPEALEPFVTASGELAGGWYEELRREALGGSFYATTAAAVNTEQTEALIRWAVHPLFDESDSTVLSLLAGGTQKMIANTSRGTIEENVLRERTRVGWARIPRPGCCAFCGMLASRGAVYSSSASAGGVVGRGTDESASFNADGSRRRGGLALGVRARGSQNLGDGFHGLCRCVVAPVFTGDTFATEVADQYTELYQQAATDQLSEYSRRSPTNAQFGARSMKATLAAWRAEHGTR